MNSAQRKTVNSRRTTNGLKIRISMLGCAASGRIEEPLSNACASSSSSRTRTPRSAASSSASSSSFPVSSCCIRKYCTSSVRCARAAISRWSAKLAAPSVRRLKPERPGCALARASTCLPSAVVSGFASAMDAVFGASMPGGMRRAPRDGERAREHHGRRDGVRVPRAHAPARTPTKPVPACASAPSLLHAQARRRDAVGRAAGVTNGRPFERQANQYVLCSLASSCTFCPPFSMSLPAP